MEDIIACGDELRRISRTMPDLRGRTLYFNRAEIHFDYAKQLRRVINKQLKKEGRHGNDFEDE